MIVPVNDYLDARRSAWLDAEVAGRVNYDPLSRLVTAHDPHIMDELTARARIARGA